MEKNAKIYVAGHNGMVGSAIVRRLSSLGYDNLLVRTSKELNLQNQADTAAFFEQQQPDYVVMSAAKVGGIQANNVLKADFIYQNLMIQSNVIHQSYLNKVKKLLFLGSSCIYPKMAPQPLKEEYLLSGTLEETNESYAIAKIAGVKMCEAYKIQHGCNFISAMPTNLYGPNDNYSLEHSHVLPAMLRKFHEARLLAAPSVEIWGSGTPLREFLHADDLAAACVFLLESYDGLEFVNVGSGSEISIKDLALLIKKITHYEGQLHWNADKPDGTPRKIMDSSRINKLGWQAQISLEEGISKLYTTIINQHSFFERK